MLEILLHSPYKVQWTPFLKLHFKLDCVAIAPWLWISYCTYKKSHNNKLPLKEGPAFKSGSLKVTFPAAVS